jgi:hypothetical protein
MTEETVKDCVLIAAINHVSGVAIAARYLASLPLHLIYRSNRLIHPYWTKSHRLPCLIARCLQIQGATHQCLYDRPRQFAGLTEDFTRDPNGPITDSEVHEIALGVCAQV